MSQNSAKKENNQFSGSCENMNYTESMQRMMDWSNLKNQMASNMQAMVAANQVTLEAMQEGARRTWENMQRYSQKNMATLKEAMSNPSPQDAVQKTQEMFGEMIHTSTNHASELAEIANKATTEAMKIYSERATELFKGTPKKA